MTPKHPDKGGFISELRLGERVTGFFQARYKQLEPFRDRSKGNFLTLILGDRSGQILARVWENAPELAATFEVGDVLKVAGDVEEYLGRTQLIVHKLRPAKPDEFDLADFLPATERDVNAMLAQVDAVITGLSNPHLSALVRHFYDDANFRAKLAQAPAARRIHHAYLGGLLEHIVDMLRVARTVCEIYPELDADLLYTGVLLFDLGKLRTYDWTHEIAFTDEGRLVGHLVLTHEMINAALAQLPDFPADLSLRVRHMLVSHHGRYEWGSPRRPQTLEALALHHLEELSADLNRFAGLLKARREPGRPWTEFDRRLGRQLYAGTTEDPAGDEDETGAADAAE
jgi:3'-5' exoribonuclease